MSDASSASRPPMKMPVRASPFGLREKMVSCVRPATACSVTPQHGAAIPAAQASRADGYSRVATRL